MNGYKTYALAGLVAFVSVLEGAYRVIEQGQSFSRENLFGLLVAGLFAALRHGQKTDAARIVPQVVELLNPPTLHQAHEITTSQKEELREMLNELSRRLD